MGLLGLGSRLPDYLLKKNQINILSYLSLSLSFCRGKLLVCGIVFFKHISSSMLNTPHKKSAESIFKYFFFHDWHGGRSGDLVFL